MADRVSDGNQTVRIPARPETLAMDLARTAVLVVDMQNDFGAVGGAFERAGLDISPIRAAVEPTANALEAARAAGIQVIYLKMGFQPDLSDAGFPDAPNWARHLNLGGIGTVVLAPDGTESRLFIRDTWNTAILPRLTPRPEDIVLYKSRFSGFYNTDLDAILKRLGITHLVITGCTTSVCVESTVRDAMFRDYSCVLLEDCTGEPIGHSLPRSNHEATLLVLQILFAWVSSSTEFIGALRLDAKPIPTA